LVLFLCLNINFKLQIYIFISLFVFNRKYIHAKKKENHGFEV
jgi:hypothetical protein